VIRTGEGGHIVYICNDNQSENSQRFSEFSWQYVGFSQFACQSFGGSG
jgi:hypothetical protein